MWVRSRMKGASQAKRFCLKIHFLVRDDKHVVVQVFARFGKISGLVHWSRRGYLGSTVNTNHGSTKLALVFFPNRAKFCPITYILTDVLK